jgi:hypothetical protein
MRFEDWYIQRNEGIVKKSVSAVGRGLKSGAGALGRGIEVVDKIGEKIGVGLRKGSESIQQYGRGVGKRWKQSEKGWGEFQMKKNMKRESFEEWYARRLKSQQGDT